MSFAVIPGGPVLSVRIIVSPPWQGNSCGGLNRRANPDFTGVFRLFDVFEDAVELVEIVVTDHDLPEPFVV